MQDFRGIVVPFSTVNRGNFTDSDFQRIKQWGCNAIYFHMQWTNETHGIEPYEDQVGVYNEEVLQALDSAIAKAKSYGLKPFIGIQNSFDQSGAQYVGWSDVYGGDYINLDTPDSTETGGRTRYIAMLEMMSQRYPNTGFDVWAFPYHSEPEAIDDFPAKINTFYQVTQPALLNAIRKNSNAPVVLNPLKQGIGLGINEETPTNSNGLDQQPFYNDKKVYYGYGSHGTIFGRVCRLFEDWNYDMEAFNNEFSGIDRFKAAHPTAKFCCIEFCGLYTNEEPIKQSRIDWGRALFEMAKQKGSSFFYFRYVPPTSGFDPEDLFNDDGTENVMAKMIQEYVKISGVPVLGLSFALILILLILFIAVFAGGEKKG